MQASRPSRATWTYFTSSKIGRPSAGRWDLRKRRWSWAWIRAITASTGSGKRRSIHGEISITGRGSGVWKTSRSTIRCIQVVPHFGYVAITMSPGRGR
jgi:hypothetical protein